MLGLFLDQRCELTVDGYVEPAELRQAFEEFRKAMGERPVSAYARVKEVLEPRLPPLTG